MSMNGINTEPKICIPDAEGEEGVPLPQALEMLTDEGIDAGEVYCAQTVIDLRDACRFLLNAMANHPAPAELERLRGLMDRSASALRVLRNTLKGAGLQGAEIADELLREIGR